MDDVNGWDRPRAERKLHAAVAVAMYGGLERVDVQRVVDAAVAETEASPIYAAQRARQRTAA